MTTIRAAVAAFDAIQARSDGKSVRLLEDELERLLLKASFQAQELRRVSDRYAETHQAIEQIRALLMVARTGANGKLLKP